NFKKNNLILDFLLALLVLTTLLKKIKGSSLHFCLLLDKFKIFYFWIPGMLHGAYTHKNNRKISTMTKNIMS
ncbi:hypothetical protein, partial [Escherichia coli]|uniref:hypothetical protein n=1 Tax=Escherichia coli TaxID=562 RepID=UPI001C55AB65